MTHRLVVTAPDAEHTNPDDPMTGLHTTLDDHDNEGAALAHPVGGFKRNTILTRAVIGDLKRQGVNDVYVRSPMVGGPADGGVYGYDAGVRERGGISPVGDQIGIASADSISEPMTQSIIGCLAEGTLVLMADGHTKKIEDIVVGERVVGSNRNGTTSPVTVTRTYDNGRRDCWRYVFSRGSVICTPDHKFLTRVHKDDRDFQPRVIEQVQPVSTVIQMGRMVRTSIHAKHEGSSVFIDAAEIAQHTHHPDTQTYDIEVDNDDHLFVLANGLIVSNSKHSGGVAGATGAQQGFPVLDKLISIPGDFGGAIHAETDGTLSSVRDAPQGGKYVTVGGVDHYVPPDRAVTAKHGDKIEAGDVLTDGLENPAKYVEHKGIGEARRRFVDAFMRASESAGFRPHRRNLELVARGYMDHVRLEGEHGEHVPGDVVSYTSLAHDYEPREGFAYKTPAEAEGMYLERPAIHHTIGTRVRPSVIRDMERAGITRIPVHPNPPPFTPIAIRSHDNLSFDSDPLTRMLGSGLEKGLLKGVARGESSDLKGTSWVPSLAEGAGFNSPDSKTRAWNPSDIKPVV